LISNGGRSEKNLEKERSMDSRLQVQVEKYGGNRTGQELDGDK